MSSLSVLGTHQEVVVLLAVIAWQLWRILDRFKKLGEHLGLNIERKQSIGRLSAKNEAIEC